jgi:predicted outer membrane repeat protein
MLKTNCCSLAVLVAMVSGAAMTPSALAATLNVPSPSYPTIQSAIDDANDNDEIVVAPGMYTESISFLGKNIVVRSSGGQGTTFIDGSFNNASTVTVTGSDVGAELRGFTIIGSTGTEFLVDANDPNSNIVTYGGGVYVSGGSVLVIEDCVVRDGNTNGNGGGMRIVGASDVTLNNVDFIDNSTDDTGVGTTTTGRGGGLSIAGASIVTLNGGSYSGNTANLSGGAISVSDTGSQLIVNGTNFMNNVSGNRGGAIFVLSCSVDIDGAIFTNNSGVIGGALHFNSNGVGSIRNSTFTNNTGNQGGVAYALGTYNLDPNAEILFENCNFVGNTTTDRGGVLYAVSATASGPSRFRVVDSTMSGNTTTSQGGAVYIAGASDVTVEGTSVDGSTSGDRGGAFYVFRGILNMSDSSITNCSAVTGGAIDARAATTGGSQISLNNVVIANNTSDSRGAVSVSGSTANPIILTGDRVSFIGNQGNVHAGAMHIATGQVTLTNSLIAGNDSQDFGSGSAISMPSASALFDCTNCTITGNTAFDPDDAITGTGTLNLTNSILWNNDAFFTQIGVVLLSNVTYSIVEGGFPGAGNLNLNPQFVDASNGDYSLASNSPAIDAGNNSAAAGLTVDLAGNARFVDDPNTPDTGAGVAPIVDLGAFEFQVAAGPSCPFDITGPSFDGIPDGFVNAFDLNFYITLWLAGNPAADITGSALDGIPDGAVNAFDLNYYVSGWLSDQGTCP